MRRLVTGNKRELQVTSLDQPCPRAAWPPEHYPASASSHCNQYLIDHKQHNTISAFSLKALLLFIRQISSRTNLSTRGVILRVDTDVSWCSSRSWRELEKMKGGGAREKFTRSDIICCTMCSVAPRRAVWLLKPFHVTLSLPPHCRRSPTHRHTPESFQNNSLLSGFFCLACTRYDGSVFLLTHSSDCGRLEAALAERAQQGRLAHAGVAHQDHLKEPVRGLQHSFSWPLQATGREEFKAQLNEYIQKSLGTLLEST